ncbi:hypothetical protein GCM10010873_04510 [Cypionkella aquatica]|uniref:DUF4864 domain-containing protein n=1 Tax=Cypionkella aquatica TaxID=1756042 RepID=A0AA37TTA6_9RHOB|nr:DUF4864 domain-containing protein [Cypionkella aquatica]GLS85478.1 hypothetical protein GCM10010873_04510 [Cypionkella aquatica]
MRLYLYGAVLAAIALPAAAQEAPIQQTIASQLEAFNAEDVPKAWTYASPTIKGIFGTPDQFGVMVQKLYPMVWRHDAVRMLELRTVAGNLWQRVMITDAGGRTYLLDYMMIETADGWQINAVQLLPQQGVGA